MLLDLESQLRLVALMVLELVIYCKKIVQFLPEKQYELQADQITFCLVGRPNVGKSSIANCLLNEERVIVSDISGTTRDSIDTPFFER